MAIGTGVAGGFRPRITVGIPVAGHLRTDPTVPNSSIRLLPWVFDGDPLVTPRRPEAPPLARGQPRRAASAQERQTTLQAYAAAIAPMSTHLIHRQTLI